MGYIGNKKFHICNTYIIHSFFFLTSFSHFHFFFTIMRDIHIKILSTTINKLFFVRIVVSYFFIFIVPFFNSHSSLERNRFSQLRNVDTRSGFFETSEMKKQNKTTRSRYSTHSFSSELLLTPWTDDTS